MLHGDAAPHNILIDTASQHLMLVDFKRAVVVQPSPRNTGEALRPVNPNSHQKRKREEGTKGVKGGKEATRGELAEGKFAKELDLIIREVAALFPTSTEANVRRKPRAKKGRIVELLQG